MSKSPDAFRTISEVAEELDLPQHVLRFWETRFGQIRPMKRGGGRRYYRRDDVELLRGIRHLLYGEGYTIRGVQRILKEQGPRFVVEAARGEVVVGVPGQHDHADEMTVALAGDFDDDLGTMRADYVEPVVDGSQPAVDGEAPPIAVDRDDHDPDEDAEENGVLHATRRFMGRFMTKGQSGEDEPALPPEDAERLRATLAELLECIRLLDQAR